MYEFTVHEPENCTAIAAAAEISTDVTVQLQFMKDTSPIDGKCSNIAATFTMMPVPHTMWRLLTSLALLAVVVPGADGGYPNAAAKPLLAEVKGMFDHGYEGYLKQVCVCAVYRSTNNNIFLFFSFFSILLLSIPPSFYSFPLLDVSPFVFLFGLGMSVPGIAVVQYTLRTLVLNGN